MTTSITPEERQSWISKYEIAHDKIDKLCGALEFLSRITDADCYQKLELNTDARIGLSSLFSILSDQLGDNLYELMPIPKDFAALCGGNGGQADE